MEIVKTITCCALAALVFSWGMAVGKSDARALAYYDNQYACLGVVSE